MVTINHINMRRWIMFRKTLLLTVTVLVLCACNLFAAQVDSTWVGGGGNHDWETAANWNPQLVPDNNVSQTYAVTITGTYIVLKADHSIDSLDTYGTVKLEGGETTYSEPDIELTNGLTNHGLLRMFGPDIYGKVTNSTGATITVDDEFSVYGQSGIQNFGTVLLGPASSMWAEYDINNSGSIDTFDGVCGATGNIINNATGTIRGSGMVGFETFQIDNKGLIQSVGGTLTLFASSISNIGTIKNSPGATIAARISPSNHNNQGLIEINSDGAITFDSNLINEPNGIVKLLGGTLGAVKITQKPDANFTGFGGITGNVQIDPNAIIKLTGPTNVVGDVNVPADATLEISDGQTLITGHTTCKGTIHLKGGTVIFQGGCDCTDCNIINEAGLDRNHFDINADGTVKLDDFAAFANSWLWQASWY
jgi:hypothetical protein